MGASRAVVTPLWAADMAALLRGLRAGRALRGLSSGKKGSPLVLWLYRRAGNTFSRTRVCVISAFRTSVLLALADRAKGDHEGRYQQQGTECSSKNGAIRRFVVSVLALPGRPHRWLQGKHVNRFLHREGACCLQLYKLSAVIQAVWAFLMKPLIIAPFSSYHCKFCETHMCSLLLKCIYGKASVFVD